MVSAVERVTQMPPVLSVSSATAATMILPSAEISRFDQVLAPGSGVCKRRRKMKRRRRRRRRRSSSSRRRKRRRKRR